MLIQATTGTRSSARQQVVPAMVDAAAQLEDPRGDAPGLRGLPHLRRGQGAAAEVLHHQARQLRLPAELHAAGPVGHRLRHLRRRHPTDDTAQQEPVSGAARRIPGRIVRIAPFLNVYGFAERCV